MSALNVIALPGASERRYIRLARDLAARIEAGDFAPGDRLPPERELAAQLEVSRTTVREALLALELMRYVDIRVGSGVFVLSPPAAIEASVEPDEVGPFETVEMRRVVEGAAARWAAARMDEAQIAGLWRVHRRMERAVDDVPAYDRADREFHALIAEGAGNALMERTIRELWDMRGGPMWRRWYDQTRSRENRLRTILEHERIARSIERGLPEAAQTAMHGHIDVLAERFFQLDIDPAADAIRRTS
ncbi:MAG: FCD domain-containing protein [Pseudomonadota bacterium]